MIDDAFCMKALEWLDPDHFTTQALGWGFTQVQNHWKNYQSKPGEIIFREVARKLPAEKRVVYEAELDAIVQLGLVPDAPYVKHELSEFCKRATFADAHGQAAELLKKARGFC